MEKKKKKEEEEEKRLILYIYIYIYNRCVYNTGNAGSTEFRILLCAEETEKMR